MNVYKLSENYRRLYEMDDIDSEVFQDTLDSINDAVEEKLKSIAHLIVNLEADNVGLVSEEKRIKEKRTRNEKKRERLMQLVETTLTNMNLDKFNAGTFTYSFRKSKKVVIDDESELPSEYFAYKATVKKKEIGDAIKSGKDVPGARVVDNRNLGIK